MRERFINDLIFATLLTVGGVSYKIYDMVHKPYIKFKYRKLSAEVKRKYL